MGQGKLEIFTENTSGLEQAYKFANLRRILRGNRPVVRSPQLVQTGRVLTSGPNPASALGKGLCAHPQDAGAQLCSPASLPLCISKRPLPGLWGRLSSVPHHVHTACRKLTSLPQLSHGDTWDVEGGSVGSPGMFRPSCSHPWQASTHSRSTNAIDMSGCPWRHHVSPRNILVCCAGDRQRAGV